MLFYAGCTSESGKHEGSDLTETPAAPSTENGDYSPATPAMGDATADPDDPAGKDADPSRKFIDADWAGNHQILVAYQQGDNFYIVRKNRENPIDETLVFQTNRPIQFIDAGHEGAYTAVYVNLNQTFPGDETERHPFFIIDADGHLVFQPENVGRNEWVNVEWSPVSEDTALLHILNFDGTHRLTRVNLSSGETTPIPVTVSYVQWDRNRGIIYEQPLDPEQKGAAQDILYLDLETWQSEMLIEQSAVDFFRTYPDRMLITATAHYDGDRPRVDLKWYNLDSREWDESSMRIPGLYTESEWKWIPPFDYDPETRTLFYTRVDSTSHYLLTDQNRYKLHAFNMDTDHDTFLMDVHNPRRFILSEDGKWAILITAASYVNPYPIEQEIYLLDLAEKTKVRVQ